MSHRATAVPPRPSTRPTTSSPRRLTTLRIPGTGLIRTAFEVAELLQNVAHMLRLLAAVPMGDDEEIGCLSNDEIDRR